MAKKIPDSTKNSLHLRLVQRARARWPDLADVRMRYRAGFPYVDDVIDAGPVIPLCRLRYLGSATPWGFAIYRASHDDYEDNVLPSGSPTGTAEEALDCACGLYLADPPSGRWPPTFQWRGALAGLESCPSSSTLVKSLSHVDDC